MDFTVTNRAGAHRWYLRYPRAVPLGIFLLISAIIALSVYAIERMESDRAQSKLKEVSGAIASALDARAAAHIAYLQAGAVLLDTIPSVGSVEFRQYGGQLRGPITSRGAEGIGWAPRIAREDLPAFEAKMRTEVGPDFTVFPVGASEPYAIPITYLEPIPTGQSRSFGFNMHSDPVRRLAMAEAERSGAPVITGKVILRQSGKPGFLIYMPVYAGSGATRQLKGFIYSPFEAQRFLDSALNRDGVKGYAVGLYDGAVNRDRLLAGVEGHNLSSLTRQRDLAMANGKLIIAVTAPKPPRLSDLSLLTLGFGILVAALLTTLARIITRQASEDQAALDWFQEQASIRNSLVRELNHRVKNTLANVLSMIALTRRRSTDLDSFADSLAGRIRALSATHDLLTVSDWSAVPVRAVIEAELAPYTGSADQSVKISGPDVELAPNDALSLGLAVHELATNASKYGALSALTGQVTVGWEMISEKLARIEWSEHGGPPVPEQRQRGFGLDLLEKIVAHELRNPVDMRFDAGGVRCAMIVPVRRPAEFQMRAQRS